MKKKFCKTLNGNWLIFRGCYWLLNIYMEGLWAHNANFDKTVNDCIFHFNKLTAFTWL